MMTDTNFLALVKRPATGRGKRTLVSYVTADGALTADRASAAVFATMTTAYAAARAVWERTVPAAQWGTTLVSTAVEPA